MIVMLFSNPDSFYVNLSILRCLQGSSLGNAGTAAE
jgi:hypothetical protein